MNSRMEWTSAIRMPYRKMRGWSWVFFLRICLKSSLAAERTSLCAGIWPSSQARVTSKKSPDSRSWKEKHMIWINNNQASSPDWIPYWRCCWSPSMWDRTFASPLRPFGLLKGRGWSNNDGKWQIWPLISSLQGDNHMKVYIWWWNVLLFLFRNSTLRVLLLQPSS